MVAETILVYHYNVGGLKMAENGKLKILYLLDIMRKTDKDHPLNTPQILAKLNEKGVSAERKAIKRDLDALTEAGYKIEKDTNHNDGYYMDSQSFNDAELKLLADAVASAKFLTVKESKELIDKIKSLASKEAEKVIKANIFMDDSFKMTDSEFVNKCMVIIKAIAEHKQIKFRHETLGAKNKRVEKWEGYFYKATPYYMGMWGPEYFVIANTTGHSNVSSYRLEMMADVEMIDEPATPMSKVDDLKGIGKGGRTLGNFIKETIRLQPGNETHSIKISGNNSVRIEVLKKFGNNIMIRDLPGDRFSVNLDVKDSEGIFQWLAKYGSNVKLEWPEEDVEKYKAYLQAILAQY